MLRIALLAVAILSTTGCDDVRDAVDPARLEKRLRSDPGRPGKVGNLVGLAVYQRAARVANAAATEPDPSCALSVGPNQKWTAVLSIERRRHSEVVGSWNETRTLVRTPNGLALSSEAAFKTLIGVEDRRQRHWRVTGDQSWISTDSPNGNLWYQRSVEDNERERLLQASIGTFQGLLDAVDGWSPSGSGRWTDGSDRLRCVAHDEGFSFVDRFVVRAKLRGAKLDASPTRHHLTSSWQLEDGSTVHVSYRDSVEQTEETVVAPPPDQIVSIKRDRSLARAMELADDLAADGLARLMEEQTEEKDGE